MSIFISAFLNKLEALAIPGHTLTSRAGGSCLPARGSHLTPHSSLTRVSDGRLQAHNFADFA